MKKLAAVALVPFFAGFLYAQDQPARTETTTTTTTWNGTLVDEGCRTTRTQRKESTTTTECPVSTTTTTFGLVTPEGKYVRFDDTSNTRIVEMVKTKKGWNTTITEHKPLKVRVVGAPNGDVVVLKEIQ